MRNESALLRVVVDTNLFVSGLINTRGQPYQLLESLRRGAFTVLLSTEQRAELVRVLHRRRLLHRYHLPTDERDALLALLETIAVPIALHSSPPVAVRDMKDEIILATALDGNADYLITGDEDLLTLNGDPALGLLKIVTVREFLEVLVAAQSP